MGVREVFAAVAESGWYILDKEGTILRPSLPATILKPRAIPVLFGLVDFDAEEAALESDASIHLFCTGSFSISTGCGN
jgi:hypothetical protein